MWRTLLVFIGLLGLPAVAAEPDPDTELRRARKMLRVAIKTYLGGSPAEGLAIGEEAFEIALEAVGPDDPELFVFHKRLFYGYQDLGDHSAAIPHAMRLAELAREKPVIRASWTRATADEYWFSGERQRACEMYRSIDDVPEASQREQNQLDMRLLQGKASCAARDGDLRGGWALQLRAIEIARGEDREDLAVVLNNAALLAYNAGWYSRAEEMVRESLDYLDRRDHGGRLTVMDNRGLYLLELGKLAEARELFDQVLAERTARYGPEAPSLVYTYNHLAMAFQRQGDPARALAWNDRAMPFVSGKEGSDQHKFILSNRAIYLHLLGRTDEARELLEEQLSYARGTSDEDEILASLAYFVEDPDEALQMLTRARELRNKRVGEQSALLSDIDHALGVLQLKTGDSGGARVSFRRCLQSMAVYGPDFPSRVACLDGLAQADLLDGEIESAARHADESMRVESRAMAGILALGSERERLQQARALQNTLGLWIQTRTDPAEIYEQLLRWKGVAWAVRHRQTSSEALDGIRAEVAHVTFDTSIGTEERRARLADLSEQKSAAELELPGRRAKLRTPSLREICGAIPEGTTVVDFTRHTRHQGAAYLAIVVDSRCEPALVHMGEAEPIDAAATRYRQLLGGAEMWPRVRAAGVKLHALVWAPLAHLTAEANEVIVIPDGALSTVSFAALPDENGRFVLEDHLIRYLEAPPDLLAKYRASAPGALIVGDPAFGPEGEAEDCGTRQFLPLPGARTEAGQIAETWGEGARLLVGDEADEETISREVGNHGVLHIASHGLFATDACRESLFGDKPIILNPLALSGVALAGANARVSATRGAADGVWTAEEIMDLDLSVTGLVVLSGCGTGLGLQASGQGVMGLRRGFRQAGVQTVVMSLWAVEDQATLDLMTSFYAELGDGSLPASAMRLAQLDVLRKGDSQGDPRPSVWGAFVVSGASPRAR